ncbi:hypothetical protein [Streptomyces albospinus]|uniref:hypothetical protein n=1 Tax=Streptomyces albospinus TaxID=285515 RepID=UPI001670A464|nr:hypothetical protein [Streptomyces albospinus]
MRSTVIGGIRGPGAPRGPLLAGRSGRVRMYDEKGKVRSRSLDDKSVTARVD